VGQFRCDQRDRLGAVVVAPGAVLDLETPRRLLDQDEVRQLFDQVLVVGQSQPAVAKHPGHHRRALRVAGGGEVLIADGQPA
jgi:hypothetical protein